MSRAPVIPLRPRGRPDQGISEVMLRTRAPHALVEAMAARAESEGISASEAWRRAAREWLLRRHFAGGPA